MQRNGKFVVHPFFENLEILNCSNNDIRKIDVSHTSTLTKLRFLTARNNYIKTIDVRNCMLWGLRLEGNPVEDAYLTGPSTFQIEATFGIAFDLDNIKYVCISQAQYEPQPNGVDHIGFWNRIGDALHIGECTITIPTCEIIVFTDPNFKQALLNHTPAIDTDGDGEICIEEAESATRLIINNGNGSVSPIKNLSGLEKFINIDFIYIGYTENVTSINFNNNSKLTWIILENDRDLKNIDVSENILLKTLNVGKNKMESIDITKNINLNSLNLVDHLIKSINIDNNVNLTYLSIRESPLNSLNLKNNTNLETLHISNTEITEIDVNNNVNIERLILDNNKIAEIDVRSILSLNTLNLENNPFLKKAFLSGNHRFYNDFLSFAHIGFLDLRSCPNLEFVCVKDVPFVNQIRTYIQNTLGYLNCTVSTNCNANNPIFSYYFSLSPNPASNFIGLTKKDNTVTTNTATILDISGQVVKTVNLAFTSNGGPGGPVGGSGSGNGCGGNGGGNGPGCVLSAFIGVFELTPGYYILSVPTNKGVLTTKFVKQ